MSYLVNLKKIGAKATVLASSLALVACGGGGGGYYGDENSSSANTGNSGNTGNGSGNNSTDNSTQIAETINFVDLKDISGVALVNANDNSTVQFTVKVLNKDNGGIADKDVTLTITDNEKLGVTSKSSLVKTTAGGLSVFELDIPSIAASSGKVQLTATVNGTSIKQIYTLNVVKTTTIQSNYNLSIQQGVVLNLPKGNVIINAQVTDKNGGVKSGQTVVLALPVEMQGKFSIASGSSLTTDNAGNAAFAIHANSDLTADEILKFVSTSQSLEFHLIDENKAHKTVKAAITFKDISKIVQKLEVIKPDAPIVAQGGTTTIKVRAKNSNNVALDNKKVKLLFTDKSDAYGVTIDQAEAVTDQNGYATFTLKSNSSYPIALSQQGINVKAIYTDNSEIFAEDTISVITANTNADDQLALQRIQIASSYKINAKNDQVTITVQGINNKGEEATKGKVTLSLNAEAAANGVTFIGSETQEFKNGYVTFILNTNAKTDAAVVALVKAGITANFKTDNNLTNSIQIAVEDEAKSEEAVSYLAIDPINTSFDYTQNQTITLKVKAIGVKGSALKGETVSLAIAGLNDTQLQNLGLSHTGQSSKLTDESGYATFSFEYKANLTPAQKTLAEQGVQLIASASNNKTQAIRLNFKAANEQGVIDLDYLTISDLPGQLVLSSGTEQTFNVDINAAGTDGKIYAGQKVAIGLNEAALNNGVSLSTASVLTTNDAGKATFSLKVKANNPTELANLIANGITLAVKGTRKDGSAYTLTRKVDISQPVVVLPSLAGLSVSYDVQTVSVLGGEVKVKVVARDSLNQIIPNTPLAIALSSLTGSRVSLSDKSLMTNSKGEAEFTVQVSEGNYDANLIKNGITFAIIGTNLNNGDRIQQTGIIQVAIPKDSVNLRLTADQKSLELGKTYQVQVAVKDELGANSTYPVNLALNNEAIAAGVKLSADSIVTSANSAAPISILVPKNIPDSVKQDLLNAGIKIIGSITNPKGEVLETIINFSVYEAVNLNHLEILSSKNSLSTAGDKSIITVRLLDQNNQPVRNENVRLSANNSATLIVGTPGSGHETNTSDPQTVRTDSNGNAFFAVEIDGATVDADLLVASGIELTATHTDAAGAIAPQIHRLNAFKPLPLGAQPARYELRIASSKSSLNVRNDIADVTVTLVDRNGGGVANQYVSLAIQDFVRNGAIIVGASGLTTNENGQATFKVKIDENARNPQYTAANFNTDDLRLTANFSESGYVDATQISLIDVMQAAVANPVASIVIGVNPTEVASSSDGVYYTRNLSVSVVDFDGKPLAKQKVEMDITPSTYLKGRYIWALAPVAGADPKTKWVPAGEGYYDLNNPDIYLSNGIPMNNNGTPSNLMDDYRAVTVNNPLGVCAASAAGTPITNPEVNNIPVKVPTFLGQGSTATYTTDDEGKFDLTIRYPKIYAQWLNIQIGAASQVATLPFRTTYNLGLPSLSNDYSTDGTYGPNLTSPYGTSTTCP